MLKEELTPGMLVQHILTKQGLIVIDTESYMLKGQTQCRNTALELIYVFVFELEPYDVEYHQMMRELALKKKNKNEDDI